jgi:integrase
LGSYPAVGLRDARLKAAELAAKRQARSPTVEEAAAQWQREIVERTHKQPDLFVGYIDRAIIPDLGGMRVAAVQPSDIAASVRGYRDRIAVKLQARSGGLPAARALLAVYKGLFAYAVACGYVEQSPAGQLTAAMVGPPAKPRNRVLDDAELRTVMTTQDAPGPVLRFLLATGMRLGEAFNGHRQGQHWIVPPEFSKNSREHRVWLSPLALAQLESHPWAARREQVQHWATAHAGGWSAHDLRRTFSTRLNGLGVPVYVVEKMLNHSFDGVMAVYNHATYDTERREALANWSEWLLALVGTRTANVVPLKHAHR